MTADPEVGRLVQRSEHILADSTEATTTQSDIERYSSLIGTYQTQLSTLALAEVDPGELIQPADLPVSPSSPKILLNAALALFLGLALGTGLAFMRERLDDRLAGREALEDAVGAPVLAVIPKVEGWRKRDRAELPAAKASKGAAAEAYRTIRTNLLFIAKDGDFKTVAVTSPGATEGKTTTVANLGVSLAQTGKRVIVVSADLRKPRLHRYFSLHNEVGLSTVLTRQSSVPDAIQRPTIENLRVMASGPVPPNPAELLASGDLDVLLEQLKRVADFVIIDTPPLLAVSDVLALAPRVDGVVVVVDAASTHRAAVLHVRDQLEQVAGNIIGAVFNNFDPAHAKYYPAYYRYAYTYRDETPKQRRAERVDIREDAGLEALWRTDDIWSGGPPRRSVPVAAEPPREVSGPTQAPTDPPERPKPTGFGDTWAKP